MYNMVTIADNTVLYIIEIYKTVELKWFPPPKKKKKGTYGRINSEWGGG